MIFTGEVMRFFRCALVTGLAMAASLTLGCGNSSNNDMRMRNFQAGSGPEVQKDLPLKRGNKPMPPDPPDPQAPPPIRR
jgi:hypothetical protein